MRTIEEPEEIEVSRDELLTRYQTAGMPDQVTSHVATAAAKDITRLLHIIADCVTWMDGEGMPTKDQLEALRDFNYQIKL